MLWICYRCPRLGPLHAWSVTFDALSAVADVLLPFAPLQYFLKHEAAEALEGLKETPQKLAGALGTAAEIGGGVLQHIGEKVGDAAHMVAHPGARTAGNIARQQRAEVRGVG
jgi:hypothetical protein